MDLVGVTTASDDVAGNV